MIISDGKSDFVKNIFKVLSVLIAWKYSLLRMLFDVF